MGCPLRLPPSPRFPGGLGDSLQASLDPSLPLSSLQARGRGGHRGEWDGGLVESPSPCLRCPPRAPPDHVCMSSLNLCLDQPLKPRGLRCKGPATAPTNLHCAPPHNHQTERSDPHTQAPPPTNFRKARARSCSSTRPSMGSAPSRAWRCGSNPRSPASSAPNWCAVM